MWRRVTVEVVFLVLQVVAGACADSVDKCVFGLTEKTCLADVRRVYKKSCKIVRGISRNSRFELKQFS